VAEYIRQTLSDLTSAQEGNPSAIYVTAITNNVRRQLGAVWPAVETRRTRRPSEREQAAEGDVHPDPVRRVFESLDDLREIDHLGNGYYAPTPTRLISLSDTTALVISGAPTKDVERQIQIPVSASWIARTARVQDIPSEFRSDEARWQSMRAWLGTPPGDLESWTDAYFDRAKRQLAVSGGSVTEFEVYQPMLNRSRPQAFRWIPVKTLRGERDELLLCRALEGRFGLRRYWLGTLSRSRGERRAEREYQVERTDVARLQYGVDRVHDAPTVVRLRRAGALARLTFTSILPPEERRALIAFGRDCSPKPGKFPIGYEFAEMHLPFILPLLERLGVAVAPE